ncbi:hypothetical protein RUND412_005787 [Rhizina undulata]
MFSVKAILATASAALLASARPTVDWTANAPTGYGLMSLRSASPVHFLTVLLKDNKVYLGNGYNNTESLNGNIALYTETTHGFAIYNFIESDKNTAWLTIHDDGHLEYQFWDSNGAVVGEYSGWNWTDSTQPHLAYNGNEGAIACLGSTGDAQLYFQTGDNTVTCPDGETAYGVDLMRV